MLNRIITSLCIVSIGFALDGQVISEESSIIDPRDGRIYQTAIINNTIWLAENMKFETENSEIALKNKEGIEVDGYYYPYHEANKVCPIGFNIPTENDWKEYVEFLLGIENIPTSTMKHFPFRKSRRVSGSAMSILDDTFSFFEGQNPLNLKISGMIQGSEFVSDTALTFWSRMDGSTDPKFHLHIEGNGYGFHTHKHHVISRNRNMVRKFVVRCIKGQ